MPVLQQVLGVLDLVLCSRDGDDAVLRALQWFINLDRRAGLVADLLDPLAALPDDGAGQLENKQNRFSRVLLRFPILKKTNVCRFFTSLGMVTCVVTTGPPMSLYEPLLPVAGDKRERSGESVFRKEECSLQGQEQDTGTIIIHPHSPDSKCSQEELLSLRKKKKKSK